jgi:UDP-glucose 4-epimerase
LNVEEDRIVKIKERQMNILVAGANGFLGSKLLPLLAKNHTICGFSRKPPVSSEFEFVKGDIRDFDSVKAVLDGIDVVIHLSAITAKPSAKDPLFGLDVNVKGTYNLAEAAVQAGVKKIIFASSLAVYGCLSEDFVPEYLPMNESHPCLPKDTYGLTKYLGEEILKSYSRKHDITTISLRFNWVQDTNLATASPGGKVTFWSTVDYRDIMQALILSIESDIKGNEVFNVSSENNWFNEDTLDLVRQNYSNISDIRVDSDYFSDNSQRGILDISKIKKILNYQPTYELEDSNIPR